MSYIGVDNREYEDSEMDAMIEDRRQAAKEAAEAAQHAAPEPEYKLVILDWNNTLVNTPFIDKEPLHVLPGRREVLAALRAQGTRLAVASNQGGVAFGLASPESVRAEIEPIAKELHISEWRAAFGHPNPKRGYEEFASKQYLYHRKPGPGMLIELMTVCDVLPSETLMVGDLPEDQGAAAAAGVDFLWTMDFFGNPSEIIGRVYMCFLALAERGQADAMIVEATGAGYLEKATRQVEALTWNTLRQAPLILQAALLKDYAFDASLDADDLP